MASSGFGVITRRIKLDAKLVIWSGEEMAIGYEPLSLRCKKLLKMVKENVMVVIVHNQVRDDPLGNWGWNNQARDDLLGIGHSQAYIAGCQVLVWERP
jgi:hypothetical protein